MLIARYRTRALQLKVKAYVNMHPREDHPIDEEVPPTPPIEAPARYSSRRSRRRRRRVSCVKALMPATPGTKGSRLSAAQGHEPFPPLLRGVP